MTIGAVVRALADEFPDLTISKIRFLEAEGLVTPERSESGYRRFGAADVDRLRWVLRTQRDRFWPLTAIRAALEDADRGLDPAAPGVAATVPEPESGDPVDPDGLLARGPLRLTADELLAAVGTAPADLADLVEHGLVRPREDGTYGEDDLRVARAAAGLAGFGLEARHLRVFRAAAEREVDLVEQATSSRRPAEAAAARAEALRHVLELHAALVRGGLSETR